MKRIFITGTDTEIGKTIISMLLVKVFLKKGYNVNYYKPFQTGCIDEFDVDSDAKFVLSQNPQLKDKVVRNHIGQIFKAPKAPWFAAQNEHKEVNLQLVENNIPNNEIVFLEGAGGLFVPLNEHLLTIDWIRKLDVPVILTARAGLGTINHTLLSLEALKNKKINILGVILNNMKNKTSNEMLKENIHAIEKFGNTKVLGTIPQLDDFDNFSSEQNEILDDIFAKILYRIASQIFNSA